MKMARHSFASILQNKNVNVNVISNLLGHSDIKTTKHYLSTLQNDLLDDALDNARL